MKQFLINEDMFTSNFGLFMTIFLLAPNVAKKKIASYVFQPLELN
jgi:hypothetical protein